MAEEKPEVTEICKRVINAFIDDMDEAGRKKAEKALREIDEMELMIKANRQDRYFMLRSLESDDLKMDETYSAINRKIKESLEKGLRVILCVGETAEGCEQTFTERQIKCSLLGVVKSDLFNRIVIAYESSAELDDEQAEKIRMRIYNMIAGFVDDAAAEAVTIRFGLRNSFEADDNTIVIKAPH